MAETFLFYDIETTGLSRAFDQILEFAAIRTDGGLN
jgi:exodeoxyribonuclease I